MLCKMRLKIEQTYVGHFPAQNVKELVSLKASKVYENVTLLHPGDDAPHKLARGIVIVS